MLMKENADLKAVLSEIASSLQGVKMSGNEKKDEQVIPKLFYDTSYGKRNDIMMHFVEMMSKGLIECTEKRLTEFLSETTNLGSVAAIRSLYYRCQNEYAKVAL